MGCTGRARLWAYAMKTLIDIAKALSVELGLDEPASVSGSDDDARKMVRFINETGTELARRVDWHVLNRRHTVNSDGTDRFYELAEDHARLSAGMAVSYEGAAVRGSLSSDEWFALAPVQGRPRYHRLTSTQIGFYPYPADGKTVLVSYQTRNWAKSAMDEAKSAMDADTDTPLLPCPLFVRGAVWRWMRHVGRGFDDQMAEFEAMLQDYATAEGGVRQP